MCCCCSFFWPYFRVLVDFVNCLCLTRFTAKIWIFLHANQSAPCCFGPPTHASQIRNAFSICAPVSTKSKWGKRVTICFNFRQLNLHVSFIFCYFSFFLFLKILFSCLFQNRCCFHHLHSLMWVTVCAVCVCVDVESFSSNELLWLLPHFTTNAFQYYNNNHFSYSTQCLSHRTSHSHIVQSRKIFFFIIRTPNIQTT